MNADQIIEDERKRGMQDAYDGKPEEVSPQGSSYAEGYEAERLRLIQLGADYANEGKRAPKDVSHWFYLGYNNQSAENRQKSLDAEHRAQGKKFANEEIADGKSSNYKKLEGHASEAFIRGYALAWAEHLAGLENQRGREFATYEITHNRQLPDQDLIDNTSNEYFLDGYITTWNEHLARQQKAEQQRATTQEERFRSARSNSRFKLAVSAAAAAVVLTATGINQGWGFHSLERVFGSKQYDPTEECELETTPAEVIATTSLETSADVETAEVKGAEMVDNLANGCEVDLISARKSEVQNIIAQNPSELGTTTVPVQGLGG